MNEIKGWKQGVNIEFDILRWKNSEFNKEGMLVKFWGDYINSETKIEGCSFMKMVISASFGWPRNPGSGLVVDVSELNYSTGDRFFYWRSILPVFGFNRMNYPVSLVWSKNNANEIRSLLEDEEDIEMLNSCYFKTDDAILNICTKSKDLNVK